MPSDSHRLTCPRLTRRLLLAILPALAVPPPAAAEPPAYAVAGALRRHLPQGLDPHAIGAAQRAAHPTCTPADCHAHAALPTLAALPSAIAADFAAGHTVTIDGWLLSRTEAWLCATLA